MRSTNQVLRFEQYAGYSHPWGYSVFRNTNLPVEVVAGQRADVVMNPPALIGEWRKPLPYNASFIGADCIVAHVRSRNGSHVYENRGKLGTHIDRPNISVGYAELNALYPSEIDVDRAVIMARNNVAGRVASFAESIAEARETVRALGGLAKNIDNFLVAASKKNWKQAANAIGVETGSRRYKKATKALQGASGTVSNAWLAFNFGISPIVSDMVSACILLGGDWSLRVTGTTVLVTTKGVSQSVKSDALGYQPGTVVWNRTQVTNAGVQCRLDYEIDNKWLRGLSAFGVSDVVQVGWALVPYSFLVDFVLPVSEVLKSITATVGLTYKGGSATRFCQIDVSSSGEHFVPHPSYTTISADFVSAKVKGRKMDRRVFEKEPNPVTLWIKDPLDVFPVATTLAVLGQRLSSLLSKK